MLPIRAVQIVSSPFRVAWNATLEDGMASFWIRSGDTGRPLSVLLRNMDGSDVVMPPGTTVLFSMIQRLTGFVVSGDATLSDGPNVGSNNMATYPFSDPNDTSQPGLYDAEWVVTYPGGAGIETFPTRSSPRVGSAWTVQTSFTVEVVPVQGDVGLSG